MVVAPTPLIEALVARGEELRNVELFTALMIGPAPYTDPRWVGHFHANVLFVSPSERADLGIHSEIFSDGVIDLVERGVITGARDRGKIVACFVMGSRRLMDFLDDNPMVELRSLSYTNNINVIRQFDRMVAINSALEVDLTGQVCAESIGTTQYSGVGGQIDFLQGAAEAPHGRPVLAFPATARTPQPREGYMPYELPSIEGQVSRIVPILMPGSAVTTTRALVHYVGTEYGTAMLFGHSTTERARSLISIAAPQFRESLERAAYDLHLLYR